MQDNKPALRYITVPANVTEPGATMLVKDLLQLIDEGWQILSAVGTMGGVHYIIAKKTRFKLDGRIIKHKKPHKPEIEHD